MPGTTLLGRVPSYGDNELHVYAPAENRVEIRFVGARGGVKAAITLSDYGVQRLTELSYKALEAGEQKP